MSGTYDPKLLIPGFSAPLGSPFVVTGFSTDAATMPLATAMGFAQTDFSTDTDTEPRSLGLALVQDVWGR